MDQILKKSLEKIGIEITDRQKEQFDAYHKLLEEWNKVMNLTGITEYEEVVEKHYVDSLSIVKVMDMAKVDQVIIKCADHIIDLGPEGGDKGGYIVATGTPEEIAACKNSYTGQFLQEKL